jgi:hypothetical protein
MAKVRYRLPDPPSLQGWGTILIISCLLLPLNSYFVSRYWGYMKHWLPHFWQNPQFEQILMFLCPLGLLLLELRLFSGLFRWLPLRKREESNGKE